MNERAMAVIILASFCMLGIVVYFDRNGELIALIAMLAMVAIVVGKMVFAAFCLVLMLIRGDKAHDDLKKMCAYIGLAEHNHGGEP